ncbi:capsid assembly scaffolding protein Gp46 family protein [Oenococcus oeni]|uniref:Scaffold protein n=1 Tax=Oenococcus oeni AWRIB429 TaxID=655225 RepID=D3LCF0_OENOE|nr:DUF4355 domain-containing protein [Oenococcus oeni]EFD87439.1 hypothetical protein AWRIB429_2030 [Oenococcus oeni AWRIB429]EJO11954.1 phage scaffold protein [Oenococcus oeni AWRIB576]EJO12044.1 phage scaffold protein [Oenococcus oeni AWRIB568]MDQ8719124.1 DUF4355 domain-containing protein [Oenococcus oeni]OIK58189.1 phage capsid protein [Oenococcus oeni]
MLKKVSFYSSLLNLQRFAEGGEGLQGDPTGNEDDQGQKNPQGKENTSEPFKSFKTEDEFNSWFDSAYDKRFEKSSETLKAKWEVESKQQKSYEKMTDAEKKEYDLNQAQEKLNQREQEVTIKENRANITNKLAEDGLPVNLAKAFEPAFSNTDNLETIYKAVTEGFRNALKEGVDKVLADSSTVPGTSGSGAQKSSGAVFAESNNKQKAGSKTIWDTFK